MKLAVLTLSIFGLIFQAQTCPRCPTFLIEFGFQLLSEENFAHQIDTLVSMFCEDGDESCQLFVEEEWPKFWDIFLAMDNLKGELCNALDADDNCSDWDSSTLDVNVCVDRLGDFIALTDSDAFNEFVDFMTSEDGYCGLYCEDSDDPDCLEQCYVTEQEGMPLALKGLLEQLSLGAKGICEAIISS